MYESEAERLSILTEALSEQAGTSILKRRPRVAAAPRKQIPRRQPPRTPARTGKYVPSELDLAIHRYLQRPKPVKVPVPPVQPPTKRAERAQKFTPEDNSALAWLEARGFR